MQPNAASNNNVICTFFGPWLSKYNPSGIWAAAWAISSIEVNNPNEEAVKLTSSIRFGANIPLIDLKIIASKYPRMNIVIIVTDCLI